MSIHTRSNQYGKILGEWHIRKKIGEGSGGQTVVYQISRKDADWEETCALKAVPLISEWGDYSTLPDYRKQEYLKVLSERKAYAKKEVQLMSKLRGRTNIVDYIDYHTAEWEDDDGFGCDFLIRMELLQNLRSEIRRGRLFSEQEVIKIGVDICNALIVCHGKSIMHRDIKPENIFMNDDGDYKLGDFGISRIIDACPGASATTGIGTPQYAAPEQDKGKYDVRVDLYSLGIVLYELSNQNRLPFSESTYVGPSAVEKRMAGVPLPVPSMVSRNLAEVILKACSFNPNDRYPSAQSMLDALQQVGEPQAEQQNKQFMFWNRPAVSQTHSAIPQQSASQNAYNTIPAGNDVNNNSRQSYETIPANGTGIQSPPASVPTAYETLPVTNSSSTPILSVNSPKEPDVPKVVSTPQAKMPSSTPSKKLEDLEKAAISGDPAAQYQLGYEYAWGEDSMRNNAEAVKWYLRSAEQGYPNAQDALGYCYEVGKGVKKDQLQSLRWYEKAASQGFAPAQKAMGMYYYTDPQSRDYARAVEWFTLSAKQGNKYALYYLGECYYYGYGLEANNITALKILHQAKNAGHPKADKLMHRIISRDPVAAFRFKNWVEKQGELVSITGKEQIPVFRTPRTPEEQFELGNKYYNGDGVEQNYQKAVQLYELAANAGHAWAQYSLGFCYCYGLGVTQNYELAVSLFRKACKEDIAWAQHELGKCYFNGWGVEQDRSEAVKLYRYAAEQGDSNAQFNLGYCFYMGEGILQNDNYAAIWFQKAAEQGHSEAQYYLGNIHSAKAGPAYQKAPHEIVEAMKWYKLAKESGHEKATAKYAEVLRQAKPDLLALLIQEKLVEHS